MPFACAEGFRIELRLPSGFHFQTVSPQMSVKKSSFWRLSHTGPSPKTMSRAMTSTLNSAPMQALGAGCGHVELDFYAVSGSVHAGAKTPSQPTIS